MFSTLPFDCTHFPKAILSIHITCAPARSRRLSLIPIMYNELMVGDVAEKSARGKA
jgi:hypothetical protein